MTKTALKKTAAAAVRAFDLRDLFWLSGLGSVAWGVWQIHQPAAFIVTGAVLFWLGAIRKG